MRKPEQSFGGSGFLVNVVIGLWLGPPIRSISLFTNSGQKRDLFMSGPPAVLSPSGTFHGRQFINRFSGKEAETAKLLIDSLEIHSFSNVLNSLRTEISEGAVTEDREPTILIPIRSQEDLPSIGKDVPHVAYKTFQPGGGFSSTPGSEGEIGSVIDALVKEEPGRFFPPTLSLDEIREAKIRKIVLLTDYCGSGNQALLFAKSFTKNPKLASWLSSGHLTLHVQSYASSSSAVELFRKVKGIDFSSISAAKSGPAVDWNEDQRSEVIALCETYADESLPEPALGYKESFGLYLSTFRVPNNLPQILIRAGGVWPGLFASRQVPVRFGKELSSYTPKPRISQVLANLGETGISAFVEAIGRPLKTGYGLAALALFSSGHSEAEVERLVGLEPQEWTELRATLLALDLLTYEHEVTDLGARELHRSRLHFAEKRQLLRGDRGTHVAYLPTQLR